MTYHLPAAKFMYVAMASAAAPIAATAISTEVHFDLSSIIVALITGAFGTIQIYMLSKLHTMVNSQQSALNDIARRDALNAGIASGKAAGIVEERARADAQKS